MMPALMDALCELRHTFLAAESLGACHLSQYDVQRENHTDVHQGEGAADNVFRILFQVCFSEAQLLLGLVDFLAKSYLHATK
jgi:hypothetical protein